MEIIEVLELVILLFIFIINKTMEMYIEQANSIYAQSRL